MKKNKIGLMLSKINKLGLISLIFSIVGLVKYGIICGITAIIIGIIGLNKLKKETQKGKELAIIGIAVGATDVVMAIAWTIIWANGR